MLQPCLLPEAGITVGLPRLPGFSVGPGDLNSDPLHGSLPADTSPTEPSLQPTSGLYVRGY